MKSFRLTLLFPIVLAFALVALLLTFSAETREAVYAAQHPLYVPAAAEPTITRIEPDSGLNDERTQVVIQGQNFTNTIPGATDPITPQVYLDAHPLIDVVWGNSTTLTATVPWRLPARVYDLTVVNPDGVSTTLQDAFTMIDNLPEIDLATPNEGPNDINTEVFIQGSKFNYTPTLYLGDEILPEPIRVNHQVLHTEIPWGYSPGVYTLTLVNPNGITATLSNAFEVTKGLKEFITNGPYGGVVQQLKFRPGDPNTLYASMFGAGLFISEDAGESWVAIHDHDWPVHLDVDAANPNILYFGADSNDFYRSNDNGATWLRISGGFHTENGCFMSYPVAHPTQTGQVYFGMGSCRGSGSLAAGEGGVFFSSDYGTSWQPMNNGLTDRNVQALAIHPTSPAVLLAGTENGHIYFTIDGGASWHLTAQVKGYVTSVYLNPHEAVDAWVITNDEDENRGHMYHSTNLTDWAEVNIDIASSDTYQAQMAFVPGSVWIASSSVQYSTDRGASWLALNGPARWPTAIAFPPGTARLLDMGQLSGTPTALPSAFYVGTDFGIEKTTDGGNTWTEKIEGLAGLVPDVIAVTNRAPEHVYVKTHQGIFASTNAGEDWENLNYGSGYSTGPQSLAVDHFSPDRLYLNAHCQGMFCIDISPDGGATWEMVSSALPPTYAGWDCDSFTIMPSPHTPGKVIVGAGLQPPDKSTVTSVFYTSSDYGATWDYVLPPQPIGRVTELVNDAFYGNTLYAGTGGGEVWRDTGTGLWRSFDGGQNWAYVQVGTTPYKTSIAALVVHPNQPNKVYARTLNYSTDPNPEPKQWVSADAGHNWLPMAYISTDNALMIAPPIQKQIFYTLYTSCDAGLCRSFDEGNSWLQMTGIPQPRVLESASDWDRSIVYLGVPGGIAYGVGAQLAEAGSSGRGAIGGGVYRLVTTVMDNWVYLPLVGR